MYGGWPRSEVLVIHLSSMIVFPIDVGSIVFGPPEGDPPRWIFRQFQHPHCIALAEHDTLSAVHHLPRPQEARVRTMKLVTSSRS